MRGILHIPENADVTIKLIMMNVNGDSKYSATGFSYKCHWDIILTGRTVVAQCFNAIVYFRWSNKSAIRFIRPPAPGPIIRSSALGPHVLITFIAFLEM